MSISMSLPLDQGFLRRQCPHCGREFKWHSGPTEDRPTDATDPPFYHCPYCGEPAGHDEWWTQAQLAYAERLIEGEGARTMNEELHRLARRYRKGSIKMSVTPVPEPRPPAPLVEPADMIAVASPCHPWEPIKIHDDWSEPVHCLVCGQSFALS